jgi:hypothetical protein
MLDSTFHVYVSTKEKGNNPSDWEEIRMVNGVNLNHVRTVINTKIAANAKFIRIKIQGAGQCTIHEILREYSVFPIS